MNTKEMCCSLELAQKLKSLMVPQKSLFYWIEFATTPHMENHGFNPQKPKILYQDRANRVLSRNKYLYSAFTVGELGEMLPDSIEFHKCKELNQTNREKGDYTYWYCGMSNPIMCKFPAVYEADSRAKMLIHLIENKLINVKDL